MKHQLKRSYGYSYVNNDGKGFSDTEPFICSGFDSLEEAHESAKEAVETTGIKKVCFFTYDEELPEFVSYDYVESRSVIKQ